MPEALKVEAQFNRANISNKDFTEAEDYLRAYGDHLPETLRRAVLVSAIVTYSRPFTSNDGGTEGLATGTMTGKPEAHTEQRGVHATREDPAVAKRGSRAL